MALRPARRGRGSSVRRLVHGASRVRLAKVRVSIHTAPRTGPAGHRLRRQPAPCARVARMPEPRPRLTFFFPAYTEEETLAHTVERALTEIGPLVPSFEVLAVDDGSSDRTAELADAFAA